MQKTMTIYKTRELESDTYTPIAVFERLVGEKKFLLESSSGYGEKGRYSFIGVNPFKEIIGTARQVSIRGKSKTRTVTEKPINVLKEHIPYSAFDLPFPFYGGAVGYIGYDTIREYEEVGERLKDEIHMPDVHLMFYQDVVVFDHEKQTAILVVFDGEDGRSEANMIARLDEMEQELHNSKEKATEGIHPLTFSAAIDKEKFMEMVQTAKQHIIDGDVFQVVLSQRMEAAFEGNSFSFYRKLRVANPSPYMFYVDFAEYVVLGASPESLIKVTGEEVITNPIAGTRPRGESSKEDEALAKELLADEKERAEHKMLVDLSRNDLGRVCEIGSISIRKYMEIERYQHVMHIVSEVGGKLAKGMTGLDVLSATLPAGTVSGAPKIRAMQIINEQEERLRGVYAGSVGYININGDIDLALAIRTMVVKDKKAYVQAGAGIVYDSDPASEYQETLNKAKSLLEVGQK